MYFNNVKKIRVGALLLFAVGLYFVSGVVIGNTYNDSIGYGCGCEEYKVVTCNNDDDACPGETNCPTVGEQCDTWKDYTRQDNCRDEGDEGEECGDVAKDQACKQDKKCICKEELFLWKKCSSKGGSTGADPVTVDIAPCQ